MSSNKLSSKIEGEEFLVLHEFAKKAKENISKESWDYLIGAAETETTFKRNRYALDSLAFRPRVLRDVENIDLTTELFDHKLRIPRYFSPNWFYARLRRWSRCCSNYSCGRIWDYAYDKLYLFAWF